MQKKACFILTLLFCANFGCRLNDNSLKGKASSGSLGEILTLNVEALTEKSVQLDWTYDSKTDEFLIAYQAGSTPPADCSSGTVISVDGSLRSKVITGLDENTQYSFRICATSSSSGATDGLSASVQTPLYCEVTGRKTNSPYANSNEAGIDGSDATKAYTICTAAQMNAIGANSSDWGSYFLLKADIDMSGYTGQDYNIIGNSITQFTGTFDGNNHVISNFSYYDSSGTNLGLFGLIGNGSWIKNLGVVNGSVSGDQTVGILVGNIQGTGKVSNSFTTGVVLASGSNQRRMGGLVGQNNGTVENCFSSADVGSPAAGARYTAGLVAFNIGTIRNSFATGRITSGGEYVGGLVGSHSGTVENSFATGTVSGVSSGVMRSGGLIGVSSGTITNSYFDNQAGKCTDTFGVCNNNGTGVDLSTTPDYFFQSSNAPMSAWDFVTETINGTEDIWKAVSNGAPIFARLSEPPLGEYCWSEFRHADSPYANSVDSPTGADAANAITICTPSHLVSLGNTSGDWGKYFRVENHLNLAHLTGTSFPIIGNLTTKFTGTFDGQFKEIHNFTFDEASTSFVGLFGRIDTPAMVMNVRLINAQVNGNSRVGSLVGVVHGGTVTKSSSSGSINGAGSVGGLIGLSLAGTITNVYSTANISGSSSVGGLVGENNTSLSYCYATGDAISPSTAGGLVGQNDGATAVVSHCFALGNVEGEGGILEVGPLIGENKMGGSWTNSYFLSTSTCVDNSGICNTLGTPINVIDYFFDSSNEPLASWDFDVIWMEVENNLPDFLQ